MGVSEADEWLYYLDSNSSFTFQNFSNTLCLFRINLGAFIYNQWEQVNVSLDYSQSVNKIDLVFSNACLAPYRDTDELVFWRRQKPHAPAQFFAATQPTLARHTLYILRYCPIRPRSPTPSNTMPAGHPSGQRLVVLRGAAVLRFWPRCSAAPPLSNVIARKQN